MPSELPPFIADQSWSLLTDFDHPRQHLQPSLFRIGSQRPQNAGAGDGELATADVWAKVPPQNVLSNSIVLNKLGSVTWKRLVITTDAGVGKSTAMAWMGAAGNQPRQDWLGITLRAADWRWDATLSPHDAFIQVLASKIENAAKAGGCSRSEAIKIVERFRRRGKLILLLDELDQMEHVAPLQTFLESDMWDDCRLVIAGRPYAIQTHWEALFAKGDWRFVRVDEFEESQRRRYLGRDAQGRWRYDEYVREDAKPILAAPRVLSYLRSISDAKLHRLSTASAIFYEAVCEMIRKGLKNSKTAAQFGRTTSTTMIGSFEEIPASQVREVLHLLSLVAYEMTAQQEAGNAGPNFLGIPRGKMSKFEKKLQSKFRFSDFHRDWKAISALSTILSFSLFDGCGEGIWEINFSNRGWQEFLCAFFLSQHATAEEQIGHAGPDQGVEPGGLWNWIYLPLRPETDAYYGIWKYLVEMPTTQAVDDDIWLESIAPLFYRCQQVSTGDGKSTWMAKRSCEMMYRVFPRLDQLCQQKHPRALDIREHWWSEFEDEWKSGKRGEEGRTLAQEIVDDLIEVPEGSFMMGSPSGKTDPLDGEIENRYRRLIDEFPHDSSGIDRFLEEAGYDFGVGRAAEVRRLNFRSFCQNIQQNGLGWLASVWGSRADEHWHEQFIEKFALGRRPCLSQWFRLFATDHGDSPLVREAYKRYSDSSQHPVIYIDFYSAHLFCKWLRWEGTSCQLPFERQWERACKFGSLDDQDYWWGDEMTNPCPYANAQNQVGTTTIPTGAHANPLGLQDMLGNVWEWCEDLYEKKHEAKESQFDTTTSRVVRGGSFDLRASSCRSGFRGFRLPTDTSRYDGFRIARAPKTLGS